MEFMLQVSNPLLAGLAIQKFAKRRRAAGQYQGRARVSMDLPAAMARFGLQPSDVQEADLEWTNGGCGTGNFAIDNAILPRCPPGNFEGVQWRLMLQNNNPPRYVRATP